jgi:hypothetical protein
VSATLERTTTVPVEDGVYYGTDVNELDYHADRDSLSSSGARKILEAPALFHFEQQQPPTPKPQYDMGHVVHGLILGVGLDVVPVDATNWTTKAAKDARDAAHAEGKVPLLAADLAKAEVMAKAVREHHTAGALLAVGDPEITGYWHDEATAARLRLRTDWLHPGRNRIIGVDVKTTAGTGNPAKFAKSCADFGYHQQAAWYLDGLAATGVSPDAAFLFIVVPKDPPHLVTVCELTADDIERGRALNRKAINTYAECRATNHWPGYGEQIHRITIPAYARYQEETRLA